MLGQFYCITWQDSSRRRHGVAHMLGCCHERTLWRRTVFREKFSLHRFCLRGGLHRMNCLQISIGHINLCSWHLSAACRKPSNVPVPTMVTVASQVRLRPRRSFGIYFTHQLVRTVLMTMFVGDCAFSGLSQALISNGESLRCMSSDDTLQGTSGFSSTMSRTVPFKNRL